MSESVNTLSLGPSQEESPANKCKPGVIEDELEESKRGELPKPQTALARSIEPQLSTLVTINSLCKLMETCLAMDPQNRPKCCDATANLRDLFSGPSEHRARDEEVVDSLAFLQATGEKHLSEGRLGEAIQYIQEFRRVARLTKRELAAIAPQELLDRCRRSTSGVETVHEEEAGLSWNLALTFFASQLHQDAERQVIMLLDFTRSLASKHKPRSATSFWTRSKVSKQAVRDDIAARDKKRADNLAMRHDRKKNKGSKARPGFEGGKTFSKGNSKGKPNLVKKK